MFPTFTSLQLLLSSHQTVLYTFQTLCFKKKDIKALRSALRENYC